MTGRDAGIDVGTLRVVVLAAPAGAGPVDAAGTGKDLALGLLGTARGQDVYRVDLAAVVSKYIGETEKNLNQVLARAEELDVILLLDEADALFGERTSIPDGDERYGAIDVDYVLQRLASYPGLVVIAVDPAALESVGAERPGCDEALGRRVDAVVRLPGGDGADGEAEGQSNVVLRIVTRACGQYICRVPRHDGAVASLRTEYKLLHVLSSSRLSLPVPRPVCANVDGGPGRSYMVYPLIHGRPLTREIYRGLRTDGRAAVAEALGRFLAELHAIDPAGLDGEVVLPREGGPDWWANLHRRLERQILPLLSRAARARVRANRGRYSDLMRQQGPPPQALIHGDFGPTNILWDQAGGRVSGIIDFGSAGIGDPAADLAGLIGPFGYAEEIIRLMGQSTYPGAVQMLRRARLYASTFALQEALHGAECGDAEALRRGLAGFEGVAR